MGEQPGIEKSSPAELLSSLEVQQERPGDLVERQRVSSEVSRRIKYMNPSDPIDWETWLPLSRYAAKYASPEEKQTISQFVVESLANSKTQIQVLPVSRLLQVGRVMVAAKNRPKACEIAAVWGRTTTNFKKCTPSDIRQLSWFAYMHPSKGKALRRSLLDHIAGSRLDDVPKTRAIDPETLSRWVKFLESSITKEDREILSRRLSAAFTKDGKVWQSLSYKDCLDLELAFRRLRDSASANALAGRAYELGLGSPSARASVTVDRLRRLGTALRDSGFPNGESGYPPYATALRDLAKAGKLESRKEYGDARKLAFALTTEEARLKVREGLIDSQGAPRLGVARVLSYAYELPGRLDTWLEYLEQQAQQEGLQADIKAMWVAAIGEAKVYSRNSRWPELRLALADLQRALALAESAEVRWKILGRILYIHRKSKHPDVASSILESMKNQFPEEYRNRIEELLAVLEIEQNHLRAKVRNQP
jgi:hypothetical protein